MCLAGSLPLEGRLNVCETCVVSGVVRIKRGGWIVNCDTDSVSKRHMFKYIRCECVYYNVSIHVKRLSIPFDLSLKNNNF